MSHSEGRRSRYGDSPKIPATPTSMEELLHGGDASWRPATTSARSASARNASPRTISPRSARDYDPEEDHTPHHKKSVLSKVKEKAKKLRHSLSKKKNGQDDNTTPSWGVSLEDDDDDDDEEEDPEYFGAPMYESELAPEGLKETARQHPRAVPVVPENHMLATNVKHNIDQGDTTNIKHSIEQGATTNAYNNVEQDDTINIKQDTNQEEQKLKSPTKTLTETVAEKLAPAYATVSVATQAIASKIQSLAISPREPTLAEVGGCNNEQKWDKGVSVKEYFMNKFEPGEDDRALSHAISEAISPKTNSGDVSVVEKVKEAVSSLLKTEESIPSTKNAISTTNAATSSVPSPINTNSTASTTTSIPPKQIMKSTTTTTTSIPSKSITSTANITATPTKSSPRIPLSTNAHEVIEEENLGRILQMN